MYDRAMLLIENSSVAELIKLGSTNSTRWHNIKRNKARISVEEIEILAKAFPEYRWWLLTGKGLPEIGQKEPQVKTVQKWSFTGFQ